VKDFIVQFVLSAGLQRFIQPLSCLVST